MTTPRQQSWRDGEGPGGRLVVVSRNPVSEALVALADVVGLPRELVVDDEDGRGAAAVDALGIGSGDAVVLCDHDAPDAPAVLRAALAAGATYVAMLASRRRAEALLAELGAEGVEGLGRLHLPAGLDTGGRSPGEMALSVLAQVVAVGHGREGGPLSRR